MRIHTKQYENIFSKDSRAIRNAYHSELVGVIGMDKEEYRLLFKNFLEDYYEGLFLSCVKLSWLRRKFIYNNKSPKIPYYYTSIYLVGSFNKFLRREVGHDIDILTKGHLFQKLEESYFDFLFPNFDSENPFTNPGYYKLPFKHASLDFMQLVRYLDDKMDLLKEAEEKDMPFADFTDHVINHTMCENDLLGRERYKLIWSQGKSFPMFFKDDQKISNLMRKEKKLKGI